MNISLLAYLILATIIHDVRSTPEEFHPIAKRSFNFDDVRRELRLETNGTLETKATKRSNGCAMSCNRHASCVSFNFCDGNVCELMSDNVFSEGVRMVANSACNYHGMQRNTAPNCSEHGVERNIRNEAEPNLCDIDQKRVDAQFLGFTDETTDTSDEWIVVRRSIYSEERHGGIPQNSTSDVVEWIKWVREKKKFSEARQHCIDIGGELFGDLNGTVDQVKFLGEKMEYKQFWLGITDEETANVWKNFKGQVVSDKIFWVDGEPSGQDFVFVDGTNLQTAQPEGYVFYDGQDIDLLESVCQMIITT